MQEQDEKKYKVETAIALLMPGLISLLGDQPIGWTAINKGLKKHLANAKREVVQAGKAISKEATFYSVLVNHIQGKTESACMFDFYNRLFVSLDSILSDAEKKHVHKMLAQMLRKFNKGYLDFVGEIAVLYKLMVFDEYELLNTEEQIIETSKVSADLLLKDKRNGSELLIEILNVHLEEREFSNYSELKDHLDSKFKEKSKQKLINPDRFIRIQPVVWYRDHEQLNFLSDFFQQENYSFPNVQDCLAYLTYRDQYWNFEHRFETVKTILIEYPEVNNLSFKSPS